MININPFSIKRRNIIYKGEGHNYNPELSNDIRDIFCRSLNDAYHKGLIDKEKEIRCKAEKILEYFGI